MKKFVIFTLAILASILTFATPDEYVSVANSKKLLEKYVGSQSYCYLVGGIYQKDDLWGAVMYIDEDNNVMKILCLTPNSIIGHARYDEIEKAYSKTQWHLFTHEDIDIIHNNYGMMFFNKDWDFRQNHVFTKNALGNMYVLKEPYKNSKSCEYFNIAWGANGCWDSKVYYEEELDGTINAYYRHFSAIGLCEVPFEPEYIHAYWYETH